MAPPAQWICHWKLAEHCVPCRDDAYFVGGVNVQARNEVRVLASLNHPNIVKYFETFIDEKSGKLQIVMEYCDVSRSHFSFQIVVCLCTAHVNKLW